MTDPLAIQGNYADFKLVKTRSVIQMVIEVPIERAKEVVDAFGIPQPSTEIAVAVARLHLRAQKKEPPVAAPEPCIQRKHWDEMRSSQQAGIRCGDPVFRKWLWPGSIGDPEIAANVLRGKLGIQSRKELDSNPEKGAAWDRLDASFIEATRLPERH